MSLLRLLHETYPMWLVLVTYDEQDKAVSSLPFDELNRVICRNASAASVISRGYSTRQFHKSTKKRQDTSFVDIRQAHLVAQESMARLFVNNDWRASPIDIRLCLSMMFVGIQSYSRLGRDRLTSCVIWHDATNMLAAFVDNESENNARILCITSEIVQHDQTRHMFARVLRDMTRHNETSIALRHWAYSSSI
jgi:hypothetical protein